MRDKRDSSDLKRRLWRAEAESLTDQLRFRFSPRIDYPPFAKTRLWLRHFARRQKLARTSLRKPRYHHSACPLPPATVCVSEEKESFPATKLLVEHGKLSLLF